MLADEEVSHAFSHGYHPQHTERLAAYWIEALGGPAEYSGQFGDESSVVRMHSGNGVHEEMDRRAIECFDRAMDDIGLLPDDPLRHALHDYFVWTTTTTMTQFHGSADTVPNGMEIPKWSWDGLVNAETRVIKAAYAALNRNDVDGFVKDFDTEIERVEFEGSPKGGAYHGIDEVREHVSRGRSTWAEGGCTPMRFVAAGDKVLVSVHVLVRLSAQTEWIDGQTADVYTFRGGKVVEFRTFGEEGDALDFAGMNGLRPSMNPSTNKIEMP